MKEVSESHLLAQRSVEEAGRAHKDKIWALQQDFENKVGL